jgi:lipoyl-dependent peroxiredoxin
MHYHNFSSKEEIMDRKGSAVWLEGLKEGKGTVSTESGALQKVPYSFNTRFDKAKGTNPEELLAAAHAGCFAMALSAELGKVGITPSKLEVTCTITIDMIQDQFTITKSHLDLVAHIPGADKSKFDIAVKAAELGCPVSKLFRTEITITSELIFHT